jgi:hypothetical protein
MAVSYLVLAARLLLTLVFLLAAATKLVNPEAFRKVLPDFGVPRLLVRPFALLLPIFELTLAAALLPSALSWYGAWGALALLSIFTLAAGIAKWRGRTPDCNCFGQLHSAPIGFFTVFRNGALALCALLVAAEVRTHPRPEIWTLLAGLHGDERKAAIVGVCAVAFYLFYIVDNARPERPVPPPKPDGPPIPAASNKPPAMGIGLPIGTPAPDFELATVTGAQRGLQSLRAGGRDVVLIFSSPYCDPCAALALELVRWTKEIPGLPEIVLISRGTAKDNLTKLKAFDPSRVLLQREFEISEAYDCNSTPSAVLIGADGLIRSLLATGGDAIRELLSSSKKESG